jgi:threonine dehydratase
MQTDVTLAMLHEAAARIQPVAKRTPVLTSRTFDAASGVSAFFKCENLQTGGAFKIRGASNMIFSLDRPKAVLAYSSGNHAQATAIAARHVGAACTIVMPADAPRSKLEATRGYGANIVTYDRFRESREPIAARLLEETGATMIPPFDHPLIIAGQGTAALELLEQAPELDALVAPVGGGGLMSGTSIASTGNRPDKRPIRLFGAEPERANDTYLSFRAGRRVEVKPDTIADGLRSPITGELTFAIMRELVEDIVLVTEDEIRAAMKFLLMRMKILVEPSGAVSAAAVMFRKLPPGIGRVGLILSGGNVDFEQLSESLH